MFVFALTQVTARLADDLSWGGLLRGLLVLAAIWWAWAAYAWLTNEVDGSRRGVRLTIFAAMIAMLVASLAIPGALLVAWGLAPRLGPLMRRLVARIGHETSEQ